MLPEPVRELEVEGVAVLLGLPPEYTVIAKAIASIATTPTATVVMSRADLLT